MVEPALERFRDQILAAVREAIHESEARLESRLEASLGARIDTAGAETNRLEASLGARIDAAATETSRLGARIETVAAETSSLETRLGARIDASAAETRAHMGVLADDLRSKLSLVAEGVITLAERLSAEMRDGFNVLDRRLLRVETRLLATPES